MKYILFLCLSLLLWSSVLADQTSVTQTLDYEAIQQDDVNSVVLRFCDETGALNMKHTSLDLNLRPWEPKDVCLYFLNGLDRVVDLHTAVVDGNVSAGDTVTCWSSDKTWAFFSGLLFPPLSPIVTVPAHNWYALEKFTLQAPMHTGNFHWCVAFTLSGWSYSKAPWAIFGLVIRKTNVISLTVAGKPRWITDKTHYFYQHHKKELLWTLFFVFASLTVWAFVGGKKKEDHKKKHHK